MIASGSFFSREPAPLLGIDVSSFSVKLVELGRSRTGELVLERCAMQALEPGWITEGNIDRFDDVADAVRTLVRKSGSKTRNVAMALPSSAVITKTIVLPGGLSSDDMQMQVESEANQYIPFPLDEVSLDFCELGPSPHSAGDVEVLIAASRKEKVSDRQGLAEAAGLHAVVMDVESYASRLAAGRLIETLEQQGRYSLVTLFEVGALSTNMQVIRNDEVLYEREQPFGGAQLTQLIARHYGFTLDEAEAKKRSGDLPDEYKLMLLGPFLETLAQEMARALQFFFTSTPYNKVDHILLAGGGSVLPGLIDAVTKHTGSICSVVNPFGGMLMGPGVSARKIAQAAPSYLMSTGLALRRFHR